jgi:hypothetical protein
MLAEVLCFATGHHWNKLAYPASSGVDGAMGWGFVR